MKEFNFEEAKAGKPVRTRNGSKVRILCYDGVMQQPIVALVKSKAGGVESVMCYSENGKDTGPGPSAYRDGRRPYDLVMDEKIGLIPFDLEKSLAGTPVKTRDGRDVDIILREQKYVTPAFRGIAVIDCYTYEIALHFMNTGECYYCRTDGILIRADSEYDLFNVRE